MSKWICVDDICIPSDENDWEELVAFADAIAEQEPIDIVRCRECKLGGTEDCPMDEIDDEYFCNFGEREGE